jgi:sugar phosphate permease
MVLIGVGQGMSLGPLTVAGVSGVSAEDAGAASGVVNAAHQLGGSLGLAVLVVVFAAAGSGTLGARELLAQCIADSFTAATVMLAFALALVFALIVRPRKDAKQLGYFGTR